jgi:hypothetical protein
MKGTTMSSTVTLVIRTDEPRRVLTCPPNARHAGTVQWIAPEGTSTERCKVCGRTTR